MDCVAIVRVFVHKKSESLCRRLGLLAFIEALVFIAILLVALAYAWRKGALEWS